MYQLLAYAAIIGGSYIYHRWIEDHPKPAPAKDLSLPRTDDGAAIPFIYGRCMSNAPILAWIGTPQSEADPGGLTGDTFWQGAPFLYSFEALYIIGIPFGGINNENRVHSIYAGERRIPDGPYSSFVAPSPDYVRLSDLQGGGNFETDTRPCFVWAHEEIASEEGSVFEIGGLVEFLDGRTTQQLVDPTTPYAATTVAGERISQATDPSLIPGYRGYMCMFLGGVDTNRWGIGSTPQIQSYKFECSSYPATGLYGTTVGSEANPADVLYDLLTGSFGKLNIDTSLVDTTSFYNAAVILYTEGHGYSRAIDRVQTADEIITEILAQIDGVLYEDPTTGKIHLKLIRDDYDPADCLTVTQSNCSRIESPAAGGWTGRANKIRLIFTNRANSYRDGSASAQNQANAVGQDGIVEEVVLNMPGVCTQTLANDLAGRELAALSRPMFKCSVIVDRSFLRTVPGDVVILTWAPWHISGMVMRVAGVTRGGLENGSIKLDLIQDFFYTHRAVLVDGGDHGTINPFPGGGGIVG